MDRWAEEGEGDRELNRDEERENKREESTLTLSSS